MKKILILSLSQIITFNLFAQLNLSGEYRPRSELRHGYRTLFDQNMDPVFLTSHRMRLNLDANLEKITFFVSLQDIRIWGSTSQLNSGDDFFSIHQAWVELEALPWMKLKLGRQEVIYDDHRIFGNVGWAQQGRSHDLGLVKFSLPGEVNLHLGLAINQQEDQFTSNDYYLSNYKAMQYLWIHKDFKNLGISLLFLNNGLQFENPSSGNREITYSQTFGAFATYHLGPAALEGSFYYQAGNDGNNRDLSAYMAALHAKLSTITDHLFVIAGAQIISGTSREDLLDPDRVKSKSFTPYYGTNHKFNGHMDYFYVGNHSDNVGLNDMYGGIEMTKGSWSGSLVVHQFLSYASLSVPAQPGVGESKNLGTEIDLAGGYDFNEIFSIQMGYSHLFASESMEILKGGDRQAAQYWAWVMLNVNLDLLNRNKNELINERIN